MKAQFNDDIPVMTTNCPMTDGVDITDVKIPIERMRLVNGVIVDALDFNIFYIDTEKRKHLINNGYQKLACNFNDDLVLINGKWVVIDPVIKSRENMVLTRTDAKIRLMEMGLFTQINDAIMAMPDCFLKIKWTDADLFKRLDVDLCEFLHGLGMTDEQIDELFTS